MKNQNDLIFSIVFTVLGLIAVGVAFATKPEVPPAPAVSAINTSDAPLPTGTDTTMGLALGGGNTAGGTGGGMGGPGGMMGRGPGGMSGSGGYPGAGGMSGSGGYPGAGGRPSGSGPRSSTGGLNSSR